LGCKHSLVRSVGDIRLALISLIIFVAWLVAAQGWIELVSLVWLAYPALVTTRLVRLHRNRLNGM
jgi:hypothetical protein